MNVLFVDDQVSVLDGIAAGVHFEELGIDVVRYATGSARAMEIIESIPMDVVLCDVEMPGESGLQLIRRILEKYPDIVAIMLTSHAEFEYAQESVRLGCFDYIIQPAPYEEIEDVLRRALQHRYENQKRNQLYEVGKRLQTGEMELLDRVTMGLFSSEETDVNASIELLNLVGYSISKGKKAQVLILSVEQFRRSELIISTEKEYHKLINNAMKQAGISYPLITISTLSPQRDFVILVFSRLNPEPELPTSRIHQFFDAVCCARPDNTVACYVGEATPFDSLRREYRKLRDTISGQYTGGGVLQLHSDDNSLPSGTADFIKGDGSRWRALLENGQYRILMNEFEDCLSQIEKYSTMKSRALCDLHQRITHMFFSYFYANQADVHALFQSQYSYYDFMGSYSDGDSLRKAMEYMMKQVNELGSAQRPSSDVEKAKSFIIDNIGDAITVKDVADHVCLSAEYFTKLFKRETGQNIKEYITQMKVAAAKDMLEHSNISVGMVALELGYTNFSHFSQVFKKYENMTPSEYRAGLTGEQTT